MQIQLNAPRVWVATESVDFRKAAHGLLQIVHSKFNRRLDDELFVFFNRSRTMVKLLGYHRNGVILIYKKLEKKRFVKPGVEASLGELTEQQLSWLLAGLDWISMGEHSDLAYEDYY